MNTWVRDTPRVREMDGKTLQVNTKDGKSGIFFMRLHESAPDGERRDGHVILTIEPHDLDAGLNMDAIYASLHKSLTSAP